MLIRRRQRSHRRTMRRLSTNSAAPVALHGIVLRAGGGAICGLPGAVAGPDNIAVVFVPHAQDEAQLQCCKRTDPSAQLMLLKRCSGVEAGTPQVKARAESRRKRCMTAQDACALLKRLTRVAVRSECGAWQISAHSRHALHQRKHVFPLCKCASSRSEFSSHLALCPAGVLAGGARLVAPQARQPCRIGRVLQRELPKQNRQIGELENWRSRLRNVTCRNCTLKHCRCNTFRRQPMRCSLASDQAGFTWRLDRISTQFRRRKFREQGLVKGALLPRSMPAGAACTSPPSFPPARFAGRRPRLRCMSSP